MDSIHPIEHIKRSKSINDVDQTIKTNQIDDQSKKHQAFFLQTSKSIPDLWWQAIVSNDAAFDGQFFYGVLSTHIFCRPSCKSRPPKKEHVLIFNNADEAMDASFRPCKRCKPTGTRLPEQEWIDTVKAYIEEHHASTLSLQTLGDISHSSPYHLHRTFKKLIGMTPNEYVQLVRIDHAKKQLAESEKTIADIGAEVGLDNPTYFATLFKKQTGMSPSEYRSAHERI
ncbi:bifunctional transcriptional activator/DNA repair enzyme AdaA [Paenibacillus sp. 1001270B_150601_E10]|uniref:bifunctional transcriptional activator/DNA repair enzyme AdaA n=1 Tax=Paenibacillus sp. 1001270B_150601_E10 TaxID=2787079 RepID=UPI00189C7AEA|nr:bifunctional transcriptional activator/DNA repair enzyme AdaA [Paenibacillus sp. 1001270B_150601_E10]